MSTASILLLASVAVNLATLVLIGSVVLARKRNDAASEVDAPWRIGDGHD